MSVGLYFDITFFFTLSIIAFNLEMEEEAGYC